MKYSIRVNEVKKNDGNLRAFATVVFGDCFKITNIAILGDKESGPFFISMPRYRTNERNKNGVIYKDVCNPITKEFRDELYGNILATYENLQKQDQNQEHSGQSVHAEPKFTVSVTPFEKDGSNIRGIARIYFEDSFIVNNVNILQGKENMFVAMPSYKSRQTDERGKSVYHEVCYPDTKEFREKLYEEIIATYEREVQQQKDRNNNHTAEKSITEKETYSNQPSIY